MEEKIELRIYGDASLPALVYLPGLHGDWTLIGGLRAAVAGRVRFVEMTYPRTLTWSLDNYAAAIEEALLQHGISSGWLLGESFGSQPLWAIVARGKFQAQGIILAGGFVRYPNLGFMRLLEKMPGDIITRLFVRVIFGYAKIVWIRYRHSPETLATLNEFIARRTPEDRHAAVHRLHLVVGNDPRETAMKTKVPVYAISGILDPIVPWPQVRHWLRKKCPALRDYKIVRSDHNVLNTGRAEAVKQILRWMAVRDLPLTVGANVQDSSRTS